MLKPRISFVIVSDFTSLGQKRVFANVYVRSKCMLVLVTLCDISS